MTARTSDPITSHLAATYIDGKRPGLRDAFLMALKALGPSTANEIADWCVIQGLTANAESVRKRAKELIVDGLIELAGERACKKTGLKAGTVRLRDGVSSVSTQQQECATANRRQGTSDSGRDRTSSGDSQAVHGQQVASLRNQTASEVSTPEAERVKAVAEFVKHEREWIDNWRVAQEMSSLAKANGMWPNGTVDEYCRACDSASAQGLIEQEANRVRAKRVKPEVKFVQKGFFDADS